MKAGDIVLGRCPTGGYYFDVVRGLFQQTDALGQTYPAAILTRRTWAPLVDLIIVHDLTAEVGAIVAKTLEEDRLEAANEAWDRAYRAAWPLGGTEVASKVGEIAYLAVKEEAIGVDDAIEAALHRLRVWGPAAL